MRFLEAATSKRRAESLTVAVTKSTRRRTSRVHESMREDRRVPTLPGELRHPERGC